MAIDSTLLELLRCPETHLKVREADAGLLSDLNKRIAAGGVHDHAGTPISEALTGGLVREDGKCVYPVLDGVIPNMLIDERIDL